MQLATHGSWNNLRRLFLKFGLFTLVLVLALNLVASSLNPEAVGIPDHDHHLRSSELVGSRRSCFVDHQNSDLERAIRKGLGKYPLTR